MMNDGDMGVLIASIEVSAYIRIYLLAYYLLWTTCATAETTLIVCTWLYCVVMSGRDENIRYEQNQSLDTKYASLYTDCIYLYSSPLQRLSWRRLDPICHHQPPSFSTSDYLLNGGRERRGVLSLFSDEIATKYRQNHWFMDFNDFERGDVRYDSRSQ